VNVILIGMKHCGKTADGQALAARWHCPFYDVDQLIEETNECETGRRQTVREIFSAGENRFQELEAKVVRELSGRVREATGSNVIAVGGRTALNKEVDALLGAMGTVVYLEISPEEAFARVKRSGLPPFLDKADPEKHFRELYNERDPHYRRMAQLTMNVNGLDAPTAAEKLNRVLEEHSRGRGRIL
jgi:shikimate kinase